MHPAAIGTDDPDWNFENNAKDIFNFGWIAGYIFRESLAFGNLVLGRVLDRFPWLKICLPHGGGFVAYQLGRFAEAAPLLARVAAARPESVDAHYNLAVTLARLGRPGDALGHFQAAARLAPGAADVQFNLGNVLLELGRTAEARGHFAEAWRLDPTLRAAREMLERLEEGR